MPPLGDLLFWTSAGVVGYAYAGYGLHAALVARLRPRPARPDPDYTPPVTLVIPCYNEAGYVEQKLRNSLELDYPRENLEIVVVVSGSDDGTEAIVRRFAPSGVRCIVQKERSGKEAAMQEAARSARGEILVFTDANAWLNTGAVRALAQWFADPAVGCVSGEKRVITAGEGSAGGGEGAYWRYESALKRIDSRIGSTMGAAGELVAVRASLMSYQETDNIIEDFMLSMRVVERGYRVLFEPEAVAAEEVTVDVESLFERRARIAAGGFQSIWRLRGLLDPRRNPLVWWQYVSHRVLRWALVPFLLVGLVPVNAALALRRRGVAGAVYRAALVAQIAFYAAAFQGWRHRATPAGRRPWLYYPFFFSTVNAAVLVGCWRLLSGRQTVLWKRTRP